MLKDDFPLASRFALGGDTVFDCVSIANRCWQTDDSAALSAAHPEFLFRTRPQPRLSSIVYFLSPPSSARKVHSDGRGRRLISIPVDQSPHPTAKFSRGRENGCVRVTGCLR